MLDYKARSYSPYLNRFIQPDTIVPELTNPQALNRYSYVNNSPILFNDPSGHGGGGGENPLEVDEDEEEEGVVCVKCHQPIGPSVPSGTSEPNFLERNLLDWVPILGQVRGIVRGVQMMDWADDQPGWGAEQKAINDWYQCNMSCHFEDIEYDPEVALAGPPTDTPLNNVFGSGLHETTFSTIELGFALKGPDFQLGERTWVAPWGNRVPLINKSPTRWFKGITGNLPHLHIGLPKSWRIKGLIETGAHWHRPWDDIVRVVTNIFK